MRSVARRTLLPLLLAGAAVAALAAAPPRSTPLTPGLWMLRGEGGNIPLAVGSEAGLLVDIGLAVDASALRATPQQLAAAAPRWIVDTHLHDDPGGDNASPSATVVATAALRERRRTPRPLWRRQFPAQPAAARPWPAVQDRLGIHLDEQDVAEVRALPGGHTDGDAMVSFAGAGVLAPGDHYFAGLFPIVHPGHGGRLPMPVKRPRAALTLPPADGKVVPGHGPLVTRDDLADRIAMMEFSLEHAARWPAEGERLTQPQAARLPGLPVPFQHGYRRPAQGWDTVWTGLT